MVVGSRLRQRARHLVVVALVVPFLASPTIWLFAHRLSSTSPRVWTTADLPPPVHPTDNGWELVEGRGSFPRLGDSALGDLADSSLDLSTRVDRFEGDRPAIGTAARDLALDIAFVQAAIGRSRYADTCAPGLTRGTDCGGIHHFHANDLALLAVWDRAAGDDFPRAFELLDHVLVANVDYVSTTRTGVGLVMAGTLLKRSLLTVELLLVLAERATLDPDAWSEPRSRIASAVDELCDEPLDPERIVVSEYVFDRDALDVWLASTVTRRWTTDARLTAAWLDDAHGDLHDHALGRGSPPVLEDPTARPLWWVYNPGGKLFIHRFFVATRTMVTRGVELEDEIERRATALHDRLATFER